MIAGLAPLQLFAQNLEEFAKRITEFTLPNGLHFIVMERHEAPVVSVLTHVRAGSVNDPGGRTGMAHLLEHLAFTGTEIVGATDWASEKKALDAAEEAYDRVQVERNKGANADAGKLGAAEIRLKRAIDQARTFAKPTEFTRLIEENGGVELKAVTKADTTQYSYSLPSNRMELWFLLESQRLLRPVFRDFYATRDAVEGEHREQVEVNLQGRLAHALLTTAFSAHPYRNPVTGWPGDVANLRRMQANEFFEQYYSPGNITMVLVGDVDPTEARKMADRYFAPLPARPLPPPVHIQEPAQSGPKTIVVQSAEQVAIIGYKRPSQYDRDDATFDIMHLILSQGRTGWLVKEMVLEKKIARAAQTLPTFPGGRYPNLFSVLVAPAAGHTVDENQRAADAILNRLAAQSVDAATLARAKMQARVAALRLLSSNSSTASLLAIYHADFADWKRMFSNLDDLQKVTADDVLRTARKYFTPLNRTLVLTAPPPRVIAAPAPRGRK